MTERPVTSIRHRGMAAQKATEVRRLLAEVAADQEALRQRQEELETQLMRPRRNSGPTLRKRHAILLRLFATPTRDDPRRQRLVASVLEDFARLTEAEASK